MTVRPMRESDIPALEYMADRAGYPYPDLRAARIEAAEVVVDDDGNPIAAAVAVAIPEVYFYCADFRRPLAKLHVVRMLHESMIPALKAKGYSEANGFIPPSLAVKFGRRLARTFSWAPNWPSWCRRF